MCIGYGRARSWDHENKDDTTLTAFWRAQPNTWRVRYGVGKKEKKPMCAHSRSTQIAAVNAEILALIMAKHMLERTTGNYIN